MLSALSHYNDNNNQDNLDMIQLKYQSASLTERMNYLQATTLRHLYDILDE